MMTEYKCAHCQKKLGYAVDDFYCHIKDGKILFKDKTGHTAQDKIEKFYSMFGVGPAMVARQGISALRRDTGIKVSPGFQMWPTYLLKRLSPTLYQGISRFFFKHLVFRDSK